MYYIKHLLTKYNCFFRREPEDIKSIDADRDVFNERPSKEDIISSTEAACKLTFIIFYNFFVVIFLLI